MNIPGCISVTFDITYLAKKKKNPEYKNVSKKPKSGKSKMRNTIGIITVNAINARPIF